MRCFFVVILLLLSSSAFANEAFVCVADLATGFSFDDGQKKWRATNFRTRSKYLVSKSKSSGTWEVKAVGDNVALSACSSVRNDDELVCSEALGWDFRMNRYNRRFLYVYMLGYWDDRSRHPQSKLIEKYLGEGKRTPFMEIGTCSPL